MPYYKSIADEDVIKYKTTARYLVEELIELVADENYIFSQYKVLLSASNKENVRVGNPYETDFMIQYDINEIDIIEDRFHPGFAQLKPDKKYSIRFNSMFNYRGHLISDRLMFTFFRTMYHITNRQEYLSKKLRLQLGLTYCVKSVDESDFRTSLGIGAALPFEVVTNGSSHCGREHIDVVLSLHCPSYWPPCAAGWRKNISVLDDTCFKQVLDHGVSFVCKIPDPKINESRSILFRLSFSFAESIIMDYLSTEQKEAYRMLKITRITELTDYLFLGTLHIGEQLSKILTSYHLKSIFLTLSIGNNNIRSFREWLVLYLKELIICLDKKSIRHHFINDLEIFGNKSIDIPLEKEFFKYNLVRDPQLTFEKFQMSIPLHFLCGKINVHFRFGLNNLLNSCEILKAIFKKRLETLPADLSELKNKCQHNDLIQSLC